MPCSRASFRTRAAPPRACAQAGGACQSMVEIFCAIDHFLCGELLLGCILWTLRVRYQARKTQNGEKKTVRDSGDSRPSRLAPRARVLSRSLALSLSLARALSLVLYLPTDIHSNNNVYFET
jgi:hypothetical protein